MLERTKRNNTLGVIAFVAIISSPITTASATDLATRLPETSISGLNSVLEAAMTGADSLQLRDYIEQDYEGRRLVAAAPKKLQFGGRATYRKEQDIDRENAELGDRLSYSLSLSKSLFHWGALEANREKGEINLEIQELATFETYRRLALDVRKKYLSIVIYHRNIELKRKTLEQQKNRLRLEKERLEAGNASVVQVYNLEVRANGTELDLLKAENAFQTQVDTLARLIGYDSQLIIDGLPSEVPKANPLDSSQIASLSGLFDKGIASSISIARSQKSIDSFEKDLHIAKQRSKPKFGVSIGVTQFEIDELGRNRGEEIFFGGVTVTWNIFSSGTTRGGIASAAAKIEQMKHQFETAKSNYQFELEQAQKLLDLNHRILERDEGGLVRARKLVKEIQEQIEVGIANETSLENAVIALASQEVRTNTSRSEYHNALANITSLLGLDPYAQKFIEKRTQRLNLSLASE